MSFMIPVQSIAASNSLSQSVISPLLVVFDSRVSDLEVLYQALTPEAISYTLDAETDALSVITQLLTKTSAPRLAIVAHGEPGIVHLGANSLTLEQVRARAALLQEWGIEEIALYSCKVAKGDLGRQFVQQLSELTGASVAASAMKVGGAALGGDWKLNVTTGKIISSAFTPDLEGTYAFVMANANIISTSSISLSALDAGWYDQYGYHYPDNQNTYRTHLISHDLDLFFIFLISVQVIFFKKEINQIFFKSFAIIFI